MAQQLAISTCAWDKQAHLEAARKERNRSCESDADIVVHILKTLPFAIGSNRLAFQGVYCRHQTPRLAGNPCVVKKWKNKSVFDESLWDGDLRAHRTAGDFVKQWNRLNKTTYQYSVVFPQVQIVVDKGADESRYTKNDLKANEYVLMEDYLGASFEKWNSNSGWTNPARLDSSINAFCHWTFHYSEGKALFCDAQGVVEKNRWKLTDPCIMSDTPRHFGRTDMGRRGIESWFARHQCNQFCEDHWLRPRRTTTGPLLKMKKSSTLVSALSALSTLPTLPDQNRKQLRTEHLTKFGFGFDTIHE